jgi:hypothetical protein
MQTAKGELVPGGLAMVYGMVRDVHLNGAIVELVEYHSGGDYYSPITGDGCTAPEGWLVRGDALSYTQYPEENGQSVIESKKLMPIKPEADPLHTEQEKCMTAY